ncbi:MAG: glycosyltransferase family 2 protein [Flavobacteriaceae bacterium TMED81]|nr:MAG: glycosyltransferase family 2 protein [Flavobacteriaceae bacterium TMED81]|tara:strand:- start:1949 stop:2881 length:933 start_codon:yes stop_codon:yes gene_type:complete
MDVYFSVVIPLYNKEAYVAKTLNSVLNQTYRNFEVIIVNDCSTDNSLDVVKAARDHRIKIIEHSENKGLSASRNTGINAATHLYIAFLDADDYWDSTYLETIRNLVKEYPEESVFATHYRENYNDKFFVPKSKLPSNTKVKSVVINDFFKINLGRLILTQSCIVVHKSVFKKTGYYNEDVTFAEDIDFYIRCFSDYNLAFHTQHLCTILCHDPNSITRNSNSKKIYPKLEEYLSGSDRQKKFINFYFYCFCQKLKGERKFEEMKILRKKIDLKFLNFTQRILLLSPLFVYRPVVVFKKILKSFGIELNSY